MTSSGTQAPLLFLPNILPLQGIPPLQLGKVDDQEFKEFIEACIVRDPSKRPSAKQLLRHPFLAEEYKEYNSRSSMDIRNNSSDSLDVHKAKEEAVISLNQPVPEDVELDADDSIFQPRAASNKSLDLATDEPESGEDSVRSKSNGRRPLKVLYPTILWLTRQGVLHGYTDATLCLSNPATRVLIPRMRKKHSRGIISELFCIS